MGVGVGVVGVSVGVSVGVVGINVGVGVGVGVVIVRPVNVCCSSAISFTCGPVQLTQTTLTTTVPLA